MKPLLLGPVPQVWRSSWTAVSCKTTCSISEKHIPLLAEQGWHASQQAGAPGWSVRRNAAAVLLLRLRPIGLALCGRSHPASARRGMLFLLPFLFSNVLEAALDLGFFSDFLSVVILPA